MKQKLHFKRFFASLLLLAVSVLSWAYDFEVNGIYYDKNDDGTSVTVTYKSLSFGGSGGYSGSVVIPSTVRYNNATYNVTSIGSSAFYNCSLNLITIPESVTTIGSSAFKGCSDFTTVTIPNSVTIIGSSAFSGCSSLMSITIPESVTSIGNNTFYNCSKLTSVTIPNSVASICSSAFEGCSGLTSITIPESVTIIGSSAFSGCSSLKSVTIPNGVTDISDWAFNRCSSLTSISIPNSVTNIGKYAFSSCSSLTSITIPNSVTNIGEQAFSRCSGLRYVTIGNGVTSIEYAAFSSCSNLTSIIIPNNVKSIGKDAFSYCENLTSVTIGSGVMSIGESAFGTKVSFYVNQGTDGLLALWKYGVSPYETESSNRLIPPSLSISSKTQSTITYYLNNVNNCSGFSINYQGKEIRNNRYQVEGLRPEYNTDVSVEICSDNNSYVISKTATTSPIGLLITTPRVTASSLSFIGSYTQGDVEVVSESININGQVFEGNIVKISGLCPNKAYSIIYNVIVKYGINKESTYNYVKEQDFNTATLSLTTSQPKVISVGNVIVESESNIDDVEKNVGFEWRRTDWTSDFASNTGTAYLYEGTMEGYIRNLNAEKLWKFRPFYKSNSGDYFYGDWVGIDPSNTSYFEPTVHTYANISVISNKALVTGYVQRGTDAVRSQGFKYWPSESNARGDVYGSVVVTAVPRDAKTVEAEGRVMEAELIGLDYNSTYSYVAFVTTTEGETFYGKELSFTTGDDPTGIELIPEEEPEQATVAEVDANAPIYDLNGRRLTDKPKSGYYIQGGKKYFVE